MVSSLSMSVIRFLLAFFMSSTGFNSLVQLGGDALTAKYYGISTTALVYYDLFLTLSSEVSLIWPGKKSWFFSVYILNRYALLVYVTWFSVANMVPSYTQHMCNHTAILEGIHTAVSTTIAQVFLLLRVYAVSRKNRVVLYCLVLLIILQVVTFLYLCFSTFTVWQVVDVPLSTYHQCRLIPKETAALIYIGVSLLYDCIAFLITLRFSLWRVISARSSRLVTRIFLDGTIYFIVIFTLNLVWLISILFARPNRKFMGGERVSVLTSLMVTRFVLSLRQVHADQLQGTSFTPGDFTCVTIQFRRETEQTSLSACQQPAGDHGEQNETDWWELIRLSDAGV